jgi:hypothetical protein
MADQTPQYLDLTPEIINIDVVQKTDATIEFQLTDGAGAAVDISNDDVKFTARTEFGGTATIATKTNGVGQHSTPGDGKTVFILTKANLTTVTPGDEVLWVYEVRRKFAGTLREVVYIQGNLKLTPAIDVSV